MVENTSWPEIEYNQANKFAGSIVDSMFPLARTSFVFNGIMFGSASFIISDNITEGTLNELRWVIGIIISMFSISYNLGALSMFKKNCEIMMSLHDALKIFESNTEGLRIKIHSNILSNYAEDKKWGVKNQTIIFFSLLIVFWAASFIFWMVFGMY